MRKSILREDLKFLRATNSNSDFRDYSCTHIQAEMQAINSEKPRRVQRDAREVLLHEYLRRLGIFEWSWEKNDRLLGESRDRYR